MSLLAPNVNELVSTHGYSQNPIIVWRYPTMSKLATLTGHTYRVLYLAISPDGQGAILPGYHADIVVWKPETEFQLDDSHAIYHKHQNISAYLGKQLSGKVVDVLIPLCDVELMWKQYGRALHCV